MYVYAVSIHSIACLDKSKINSGAISQIKLSAREETVQLIYANALNIITFYSCQNS